MKNALFAFLIFILPSVAFSQVSIQVKEVNTNMSKGINNGFEVEIPATAVKDVERDWKRRLTVGNKAKLAEANGEIAVHGIDNKDISPKLFNLYSVLVSNNDGVKLTAWFTYNDTTFFTTAAAKLFMHDFATAEYFLAVKSMHQKERDKLEKLKDDLERSIKIEEKSELKITDNKRAIARAQDDLVTNDNDQKEASTAINLQQAELNKDRNGNAEIYKAADKELKEMQDGKKRLQDHNLTLHKKIDEWNKEIANEERSITVEKQSQGQTAVAIEKQKSLIADLAAKLKAIK
jgi:hypothetical protein